MRETVSGAGHLWVLLPGPGSTPAPVLPDGQKAKFNLMGIFFSLSWDSLSWAWSTMIETQTHCPLMLKSYICFSEVLMHSWNSREIHSLWNLKFSGQSSLEMGFSLYVCVCTCYMCVYVYHFYFVFNVPKLRFIYRWVTETTVWHSTWGKAGYFEFTKRWDHSVFYGQCRVLFRSNFDSILADLKLTSSYEENGFL